MIITVITIFLVKPITVFLIFSTIVILPIFLTALIITPIINNNNNNNNNDNHNNNSKIFPNNKSFSSKNSNGNVVAIDKTNDSNITFRGEV